MDKKEKCNVHFQVVMLWRKQRWIWLYKESRKVTCKELAFTPETSGVERSQQDPGRWRNVCEGQMLGRAWRTLEDSSDGVGGRQGKHKIRPDGTSWAGGERGNLLWFLTMTGDSGLCPDSGLGGAWSEQKQGTLLRSCRNSGRNSDLDYMWTYLRSI